jgi:hypothetical protein
MTENTHERGRGSGVLTAFLMGAAIGTIAGLMTTKSNRQKAVQIARKAREEATVRTRQTADQARAIASEVRKNWDDKQKKAKEAASEAAETMEEK